MFGGISMVLSIFYIAASRAPAKLPCRRPRFPASATKSDQQLYTVLQRPLIAVFTANAIFAGSFLTLYFVSIRRQHTDFLYRFWRRVVP